jgi:hypothetical protein
MPRLPINYENALIYKLVCSDLEVKEIHVGSTTNFTVRKDSHKNKCINELSKSYNFKVYQYIRSHGGWSNWSMIEIEKFPCTDSKEARKRERYWMETLRATLNCQTPSRSRSEWILDNREQITEYKKMYNLANKEQLAEYRKIYNEANKEQITEYKKINYLANKEQIAEYKKIHYLAHKEQIAENQKIYNEANKERLRQKIDCPCGGKYTHQSISIHFKTQKHTAYLANIQSQSLAI